VLIERLRALALTGTELANAQVDTVQKIKSKASKTASTPARLTSGPTGQSR
jgi:hypothetical protein